MLVCEIRVISLWCLSNAHVLTVMIALMCSAGHLPGVPAQWVAESRSAGIANTTDRSFYDARLKNSSLADGQGPLIWACIRGSVGACQVRSLSSVNYT